MSTVVLTRVAVETVSPLAIYSGDRETLGQNAIVRDWNGLPYIPATAIAGVWRHTVMNIAKEKDSSWYQHWFGSKSGPKSRERMASRIVVSDGLLLNSKSCLPGSLDKNKKQLRMLTEPDSQDRIYQLVSLNNSGRFERTCCRLNEKKANHRSALFTAKTLPKGLRFAFDIKFELDSDDDVREYQNVLKIIGSRNFALGSKTANGLGAFKIIGVDQEIIHLEKYAKNPEEAAEKIRAFVLRREVTINKDEAAKVIPSSDDTGLRVWKFTLRSKGTMRIGTGIPGRITAKVSAYKPDEKNTKNTINLMPGEDAREEKILQRNIQSCFTDTKITWKGSNFDDDVLEFIIPGSTIKGVLAHRTMYHFLRRKNWFAGEKISISSDRTPRDLIRDLLDNREPPEELELYYALFGKNDPVNHDNMRAGSLKVQDAVISADYWLNRMHNKLDRFTAGVMPSALFGQMRLVNPSFEVHISMNPSRDSRISDDSLIMQAFQDTLYDLKNGFLNICAGSGRDTAVFKAD